MNSKKLSDYIHSLPLDLGINKTKISYLTIHKYEEKCFNLVNISSNYLLYIVNGRLCLYTPSGIMDYISGQYSISSVDMPLKGQAISLSDYNDLLVLMMTFTVDEVLSVVLSFEGNLAEQIVSETLEPSIMKQSDKNIAHCFTKLMSLSENETVLKFMANHIKKEIIFNILCGSCGSRFLQSIIGINKSGEIYDINNWIKCNFKENFTVEDIAKQNNMSVSSLHQKFKSAIGMGVLQCQKRLRLSEARRLMMNEEKSVTEAAFEVGYESLSQFTRDYKKMFGNSPKEDIKNLRSLWFVKKD